jgi:hypothetical protein
MVLQISTKTGGVPELALASQIRLETGTYIFGVGSSSLACKDHMRATIVRRINAIIEPSKS